MYWQAKLRRCDIVWKFALLQLFICSFCSTCSNLGFFMWTDVFFNSALWEIKVKKNQFYIYAAKEKLVLRFHEARTTCELSGWFACSLWPPCIRFPRNVKDEEIESKQTREADMKSKIKFVCVRRWQHKSEKVRSMLVLELLFWIWGIWVLQVPGGMATWRGG